MSARHFCLGKVGVWEGSHNLSKPHEASLSAVWGLSPNPQEYIFEGRVCVQLEDIGRESHLDDQSTACRALDPSHYYAVDKSVLYWTFYMCLSRHLLCALPVGGHKVEGLLCGDATYGTSYTWMLTWLPHGWLSVTVELVRTESFELIPTSTCLGAPGNS